MTNQRAIKILLIENNSDWVTGVRSALKDAGYDVLTASGGDEGFCLARRLQPELIVCETALPPDISSVELCYMIRADRYLHAIPFVLMGDAGGDIAAEGFRAGADDYLERNSNLQVLTAKLIRLIELRRSDSQLLREIQNVHQTELFLTQLTELFLSKQMADAGNLVADLNAAMSREAFDEYETPRAKNPLNDSAGLEPGRGAETVFRNETCGREFQAEDFILNKNKFRNENLKVVYYEMVR